MIKHRKREKGITLVALIITIIVLIILATVTIIAFTEMRILETASKGTENYASAQKYEQQIMNNIDKKANEVVKNITNIQGEAVGTNPEEPEGPTANWDKSKVYSVESKDGETIPVPKEFVLSEIEKEKSVNTGLVIYEIPEGERENIDWTKDEDNNGYLDVQEKYNQFVWIPVENLNEMFGIDKDGNVLGKLYDFGTTTLQKNPPEKLNWQEDEKGIMSWINNEDNRETDVLLNTSHGDTNGTVIYRIKDIIGISGNDNDEVLKNWRKHLQDELEKLKESIQKYSGFYVGRYEMGNVAKDKATVTRNNRNVGSLNWHEFYQKSKTVVQNTNIESSMIWGCQWDAIMRWFISQGGENEKYAYDGKYKGNHHIAGGTGDQLPTGSNDNYSVNNIFDMMGNYGELTIEAAETYCRVSRRGNIGKSIRFYHGETKL